MLNKEHNYFMSKFGHILKVHKNSSIEENIEKQIYKYIIESTKYIKDLWLQNNTSLKEIELLDKKISQVGKIFQIYKSYYFIQCHLNSINLKDAFPKEVINEDNKYNSNEIGLSVKSNPLFNILAKNRQNISHGDKSTIKDKLDSFIKNDFVSPEVACKRIRNMNNILQENIIKELDKALELRIHNEQDFDQFSNVYMIYLRNYVYITELSYLIVLT
jgi:hypothetical protein